MEPRLSLTHMQEIPESLTSPLPVVARVSRWLFEVPGWIQVTGALVAVVAALLVARLCWRRRGQVAHWMRTRSRALQIGMGLTVVAALFAAAFVGAAGYDYTQHSNEFCVSCHVMDPSFTRFSESEHAELTCHDCHQQPVTASLRQVYLWMTERPEEIGEHAPVPNQVCANCHIVQDPDSTWQRISATAGHRIHLESDSTVLQDAQCVGCHGVTIHRFQPSSQTCGQSECHGDRETLPLGEMVTDTTALHCVLCHGFTGGVDERGPRAAAFTRIVPEEGNCRACHEMAQVLERFDVDLDPHQGVCGDCHNPHQDEDPADALQRCATAGCHTNPEATSPFHRDQHALVPECTDCHDAHTWVAPTECLSCHTRMP